MLVLRCQGFARTTSEFLIRFQGEGGGWTCCEELRMIAHIAIIPKSTKQIGGVRNDRDVAMLFTVRPGISVRGSGRAEMSSSLSWGV